MKKNILIHNDSYDTFAEYYLKANQIDVGAVTRNAFYQVRQEMWKKANRLYGKYRDNTNEAEYILSSQRAHTAKHYGD